MVLYCIFCIFFFYLYTSPGLIILRLCFPPFVPRQVEEPLRTWPLEGERGRNFALLARAKLGVTKWKPKEVSSSSALRNLWVWYPPCVGSSKVSSWAITERSSRFAPAVVVQPRGRSAEHTHSCSCRLWKWISRSRRTTHRFLLLFFNPNLFNVHRNHFYPRGPCCPLCPSEEKWLAVFF